MITTTHTRAARWVAPMLAASALLFTMPGQALAAHPFTEPGESLASWNQAAGATRSTESAAWHAALGASPTDAAVGLAKRAGTDILRKAGNCVSLPVPRLPAKIAGANGTTLTLANSDRLKPGWKCIGPFAGAVAYGVVASSLRVGIPAPGLRTLGACPTAGDGRLPCYHSQVEALPLVAIAPCGGPPTSPTTAGVVDVKSLLACLGVGPVQPPSLMQYVPDVNLNLAGGHSHPLPVTVPTEVDAVYYNSAGQPVATASRTSYATVTEQASAPGSNLAGNTPVADASANTPSGRSYPCNYDTSSSRVYERDSYTIEYHGDSNDYDGGYQFQSVDDIHVYEADNARQSPKYNYDESWQIEICGTGTATNTDGSIWKHGLSVSMDDTNSNVHMGEDVPTGTSESYQTTSMDFSLDVGPVHVGAAISNASGATMWGGWGRNCAYDLAYVGPNNWPSNEASSCFDASKASQAYNSGSAAASALYEYDEGCGCEAYYDAMGASIYKDGKGQQWQQPHH